MNLLLILPIIFVALLVFMMRYSSKKRRDKCLAANRRSKYLRVLKENSTLRNHGGEPTTSSTESVIINSTCTKNSDQNSVHNDIYINNDSFGNNYNDESIDNININDNNDNFDNDFNEDSSDGSSSENSDYTIDRFRKDLASTFLQVNINHTQGDQIHSTLRKHHCFQTLPCSTRSLLNTPRKHYETVPMELDGEYYHIGFKKQIIEKLESLRTSEIPEYLQVDIHTDGMSIHKSTGMQLWPIQFRIISIPNDSHAIIGIYKGKNKPSDPVKFFQFFVREFHKIQNTNGIEFNNKLIRIFLRAFIADAPARAFVLNHKGRNAARPCSKCEVKGQKIEKTMCFTQIYSRPRSDIEYPNALDKKHHCQNNQSPLKLLNFPMVTCVPFEYMHLICLGVVKKFLTATMTNQYNLQKLTKSKIDIISSKILLLQSYCPSEFARRPRSIVDYKKFKATEFRQLLLYTGPLIFYNILEGDIYRHFLLLHSACQILSMSCSNANSLEYAEIALKVYVECCETIYGQKFMSYNIHGLLHVVQDVKIFGQIDNYSAFPYEDNMSFFGKLLRKPNQLLQQLNRRLTERQLYDRKKKQDFIIQPLHQHQDGPLVENINGNFIQFKGLKFQDFRIIAGSKRDNCLLLKNGIICEVQNIIQLSSNQYAFIVKIYQNITNFYDIPYGIASSQVQVYKCSNLLQALIMINSNDIYAKCYKMPFFNDGVIEDGTIIVAALLSYI